MSPDRFRLVSAQGSAAFALLTLTCGLFSAGAQASNDKKSSPTFTLREESRLVIEDV